MIGWLVGFFWWVKGVIVSINFRGEETSLNLRPVISVQDRMSLSENMHVDGPEEDKEMAEGQDESSTEMTEQKNPSKHIN